MPTFQHSIRDSRRRRRIFVMVFFVVFLVRWRWRMEGLPGPHGQMIRPVNGQRRGHRGSDKTQRASSTPERRVFFMVVIHDVIVVEVVVVKMIMMMLWRKNWSDDVVECCVRVDCQSSTIINHQSPITNHQSHVAGYLVVRSSQYRSDNREQLSVLNKCFNYKTHRGI